jgi:hypothetical protein
LERVFKEIEDYGDIHISMSMNTLEDAFINIGLDEEKSVAFYEDVELGSKDSISIRRSTEASPPSYLINPPTYRFY